MFEGMFVLNHLCFWVLLVVFGGTPVLITMLGFLGPAVFVASLLSQLQEETQDHKDFVQKAYS